MKTIQKIALAFAAFAAAFSFSSCSSDEVIGGAPVDEVAAAEEGISTMFSNSITLLTPPVDAPTIERIPYHWDNAVDILTEFPGRIELEGVCHNFLYCSSGEPFDLVMLNANGGYRHKCGIYWYDQDGDCHEQIFWNELDEDSKDWVNLSDLATDLIARRSDNAGAFRIQLPQGTKFGFFQESYQEVNNEWTLVTTQAILDPIIGEKTYPFRFYTEYCRNWNFILAREGQAMTTNINDWTIIGFDDISLTSYACDRDYNDFVYAIYPAQQISPDPDPTIVEGSVETNFSVSQENDNLKMKLSVHVRSVTDFTVVIPIVDEALADDFAIVAKHDVEYAYANTLDINGHTVKVNYSLTPEKFLKITTEGIDEDVIEYCKETYADGLTFEFNLFYPDTYILGPATITFTQNPVFYITSCVTDSQEATDTEVLWTAPQALNIEQLNFQSTGGELHYQHKVYSTLTVDQLKQLGLMKDEAEE